MQHTLLLRCHCICTRCAHCILHCFFWRDVAPLTYFSTLPPPPPPHPCLSLCAALPYLRAFLSRFVWGWSLWINQVLFFGLGHLHVCVWDLLAFFLAGRQFISVPYSSPACHHLPPYPPHPHLPTTTFPHPHLPPTTTTTRHHRIGQDRTGTGTGTCCCAGWGWWWDSGCPSLSPHRLPPYTLPLMYLSYWFPFSTNTCPFGSHSAWLSASSFPTKPLVISNMQPPFSL